MARHQERKSRAGGVAGTALAPGAERHAPQFESFPVFLDPFGEHAR